MWKKIRKGIKMDFGFILILLWVAYLTFKNISSRKKIKEQNEKLNKHYKDIEKYKILLISLKKYLRHPSTDGTRAREEDKIELLKVIENIK
jgi:pyruvate/2-oxoacid:ferredoxin oxidoreductase beta subunit